MDRKETSRTPVVETGLCSAFVQAVQSVEVRRVNAVVVLLCQAGCNCHAGRWCRRERHSFEPDIWLDHNEELGTQPSVTGFCYEKVQRLFQALDGAI